MAKKPTTEQRLANLEGDVKFIRDAVSDKGRKKSAENGQGEAMALAIVNHPEFEAKIRSIVYSLLGGKTGVAILRSWTAVNKYLFGWLKLFREEYRKWFVRFVLLSLVAGLGYSFNYLIGG